MKPFFKILFFLFVAIFFVKCSPEPNNNNEKQMEPEQDVSDAMQLDFTGKRNLPQASKDFILWFAPIIVEENSRLMNLRHRILECVDSQKRGELSRTDLVFLKKISASYDLSPQTFLVDSLFANDSEELLNRVDFIPSKLVLAQAIVESEWGKSRFAIDGNNYFGIHCYKPDCGMAPAGTTGFWLESYPSVAEGVRGYLLFLNTKRSMKRFRNIRAKMRKNGELPIADELIDGLTLYAEIGDEYLRRLRAVIKYYIPENLHNYNEE